ncbi:unnamed protein product [Danaus chrysippus]|uniref:(African queen) hypothetical protein n=1 Tax=Danaus chrysippus TaxID=151541 RepID=A0A8J2W892_9NEOP|nr:unnamed protein product [Danaus chrysippus]
MGCAGGVAALDARELKLYQVHLDLGQVSGARRPGRGRGGREGGLHLGHSTTAKGGLLRYKMYVGQQLHVSAWRQPLHSVEDRGWLATGWSVAKCKVVHDPFAHNVRGAAGASRTIMRATSSLPFTPLTVYEAGNDLRASSTAMSSAF